MRHLCVQDFGLTKRGDFVEIPDGAEASPQYFVPAPEESEKPTPEEIDAETLPEALPKARGATRPTDDTQKDEG